MASKIKLKKFSLTIPQSYDDSISFYEILSRVNARIDNINTRLNALDGKTEEDTSSVYSDYITDNNPAPSKYSMTLPQSYDDSLSYYEQLSNLAAYFNQMVDYVNNLSVNGMTPEQVAQLNKATQDIQSLTDKIDNLQPGTSTEGGGMTTEQIAQLNKATQDITEINNQLSLLSTSVTSSKTAIDKNAENIESNTENIKKNAESIQANTQSITTETNARQSADNRINQILTDKADKADTVTDVNITHDETEGTYTLSKTVDGKTTEVGTIKQTVNTGGGGDVTSEQFNALTTRVKTNEDTLKEKADKADTVSNVSMTNENGVYSLKQTKDGTETDIGTIEVPKSNNPVIEVKDSVVENNDNGYDYHTLSETTEDGTQNNIGHAYIAQNQITKLAKSENSNALHVTAVDQNGNETSNDIVITDQAAKNLQYIRAVLKFTPTEDIVITKHDGSSTYGDPDMTLTFSYPTQPDIISGELTLDDYINALKNRYVSSLKSYITLYLDGLYTMDEKGNFHEITDLNYRISSNEQNVTILIALQSEGSTYTLKQDTDYYLISSVSANAQYIKFDDYMQATITLLDKTEHS